MKNLFTAIIVSIGLLVTTSSFAYTSTMLLKDLKMKMKIIKNFSANKYLGRFKAYPK